jgi:O-antigen ligase
VHAISDEGNQHCVRRPGSKTVYLWLMGTCIILIVLAWNVVRLWSTPAAVAMSIVAALIPPVAVILAGGGRGGG